MGADGNVRIPWKISSANGEEIPAELKNQTTQEVTFGNMCLDGYIDLDVNIDKEEDSIIVLELLPPSNNARLGMEKFARVQILGKGHFDEISMNVPMSQIIRGSGMSPVLVNINRTIRVDPPQAQGPISGYL